MSIVADDDGAYKRDEMTRRWSWIGPSRTAGGSSWAASAGGCGARSVALESLLLCSVTASNAEVGAGAAFGTGTSSKAEEGAGEGIEVVVVVAAVDDGGRDVCSEVDAVSVRDIEAEWGIFVQKRTVPSQGKQRLS